MLYGVTFLLGAAVLLAVTYGLVARESAAQTRRLQLRGTDTRLASTPSTETGSTSFSVRSVRIAHDGSEIIIARATGDASAAGRQAAVSARLVAAGRAAAAVFGRCVRQHGEPAFGDPVVKLEPGNSIAYKAPPVPTTPRGRAILAFCDARWPSLDSAASAITSNLSATQQREVDVVIDQANGALALQRRRSLDALLVWSGAALLLLAIFVAGLSWRLAGRALEPLQTMTDRARRITERTLHERIGEGPRDDEVGALAASLDRAFVRLEGAFTAQRRFVANASHELRTPLARERALLEVALSNPTVGIAELRHACDRVLVSIGQQQRIIEALLTLARSQSGTDIHQPVELARLVRGVLVSRNAELEGIPGSAELGSAPIVGDPALLERLVANLIDNAISHNDPSAPWVQVKTGAANGVSWLRIANGGEKIASPDLPELFEPFRRGGDARTAGRGLGLGLSIVEAIADLHGLTLDAQPLEAGGLEIRLRGPMSPPESSRAQHEE